MADLSVVWYLVVIGTAAFGGSAALVRPIRKRLEKKVDVDMCKTLHANLTEDISEIKVDLKTGLDARIKQGLILERIETILERIDKNGNKTMDKFKV